MENRVITLVIIIFFHFAVLDMNAQKLASQKYEPKAANYKVMDDKQKMNRIDNHSKVTAKAAGNSIEKAVKEAKAEKQREEFKKKKAEAVKKMKTK